MKAHPIQILESIADLEGKGSVKAKKQIITDHLDVPEFVKTIVYALDPFKQFYTVSVPGLAEIKSEASKADDEQKKGKKDLFGAPIRRLKWSEQFSTMFDLLDQMADRKLAPNSQQTRTAICEWAKQCGAGTIEVFHRILRKDLKIKIGATTFNQIKPGWVPEFSIQKAKAFKDAQKHLDFPCFVDPKFDGERCLAFISGGKVEYLSSNGKTHPNFGCFTSEILRIFNGLGNVVIDGEVINKGGFQSLQKTPAHFDPKFTGDQLQFVVFDLVTQQDFDAKLCTMIQQDRFKHLSQIFKGTTYADSPQSKVVLSNTRIAKNLEEAYDIFDYWVGKGLEGVIFKKIEGLYEFDRTFSWIKLKPSESDDLKIIGMELGDAQNKWAGKCGALVVERTDKSGKKVHVNVKSGLLDHDHSTIYCEGDKILWKQPDTGEFINIKGKVIEVVYDHETEDGSLRFPRIKRREKTLVRTDK